MFVFCVINLNQLLIINISSIRRPDSLNPAFVRFNLTFRYVRKEFVRLLPFLMIID